MVAKETMEQNGLKKRVYDEGPALTLPRTVEELKCEECLSDDVKYRCPRCEKITCSLVCCLAHKKKYECNGKRDRTKYVELKKFTDADLTSDFFFLEEISRSTHTAQRTRSQVVGNSRRYSSGGGPSGKKRRVVEAKQRGKAINPDVPADWLSRFPVSFQLLVKHANKRGVALTLLAPGMSKRTRNTSFIDVKKNQLFWRIEWQFTQPEVPLNLFERRASENQTLFQLLDKYLSVQVDNVKIRAKLKKYAVKDWKNEILLLLKKEFTGTSQPQYYQLNGGESLKGNFQRKAIVEFPIIIVSFKADASKYHIVHDTIEEIVVGMEEEEEQVQVHETGTKKEEEMDKAEGENDGVSEISFSIDLETEALVEKAAKEDQEEADNTKSPFILKEVRTLHNRLTDI